MSKPSTIDVTGTEEFMVGLNEVVLTLDDAKLKKDRANCVSGPVTVKKSAGRFPPGTLKFGAPVTLTFLLHFGSA